MVKWPSQNSVRGLTVALEKWKVETSSKLYNAHAQIPKVLSEEFQTNNVFFVDFIYNYLSIYLFI